MPATLPQFWQGGGSAILRIRGAVYQLCEGLDLEACATHQAAVHVFLHHDVVHVARLDRAAVQDAYFSCEVFAADLPQQTANASDGVLCVLRGSGLAGPDGPDGFIGEDDSFATDLTRVEVLEDRSNLPRNLFPHRTRVALLFSLADADYGQEPSGDGPGRFATHRAVGLTKDLTPLRVPHDDRFSTYILEHRSRDLPRECPRGLIVEVLRAGDDRRTLGQPGDFAEGGKRREDRHVDPFGVLDTRQKPFHVFPGLPEEFV